MKSGRIIAVGRLKTPYWQEACADYLRRLRPWRDISVTEIRDGDAQAAPEARRRQEGERILAAITAREAPIALADRGQCCTSQEFAEFLRKCDDVLQKSPAFIIGGPFGLDGAVLERCGQSLSLSPMTWPHELARVLLTEQLYRAESILHHARYHH